MTPETARRANLAGGAITILTVVCAVIRAFPLY